MTPGSTTLVHSEKFTGVLSFLFADGSFAAKKTLLGFEGFNKDLKARVESQLIARGNQQQGRAS